ncbi:hypothetical protein ACFYOG_22040 [Streptomyces sp. NPDC007818]|uniref:hypothetical protein n=1 Tax=Streptomyces sp. NPDC007818 TaxID=3364780 RepID=UPI0036B3DCA8
MRVPRFSYPFALGAVCLALSACGVSEKQESESKPKDLVPCTVTVTDIQEGDEISGANLSYFVDFVVHVPGRPDRKGSQEPVLNPIQVAQIVAVSKDYPCRVSASKPGGRVWIDWDKPVTASPSPAPEPSRSSP